MRFYVVFPFTLLVVTAGCATDRVHVVDPQGAAIRGAAVTPVALSISGNPATTDANGQAAVPLNVGQRTEWVTVAKEGFTTQWLDVPKKWPLNVVIRPLAGQ